MLTQRWCRRAATSQSGTSINALCPAFWRNPMALSRTNAAREPASGSITVPVNSGRRLGWPVTPGFGPASSRGASCSRNGARGETTPFSSRAWSSPTAIRRRASCPRADRPHSRRHVLRARPKWLRQCGIQVGRRWPQRQRAICHNRRSKYGFRRRSRRACPRVRSHIRASSVASSGRNRLDLPACSGRRDVLFASRPTKATVTLSRQEPERTSERRTRRQVGWNMGELELFGRDTSVTDSAGVQRLRGECTRRVSPAGVAEQCG